MKELSKSDLAKVTGGVAGGGNQGGDPKVEREPDMSPFQRPVK